MNEKEKIIKVVDNALNWQPPLHGICVAHIFRHELGNFADTLMENGIGDISEWKRRADVAERALIYAVSEYRCDECPCVDCNAEIRGSQECIDCICTEYKKQAEREIEEK